MIYHNSFDEEYRSPFGAALTSSKLTIRLMADYAPEVTLRCWTEEGGEELYIMNELGHDMYSATIKMPDFGTLLWYYFIVKYPSGAVCLYGAQPDGIGGEGCEYQIEPHSFQITVYKQDEPPQWYKESIMYQIFPDRFARGSDFESIKAKTDRYIVSDWSLSPSYQKDDQGNVTRWDFYGGSLKGIKEKLSYLSELGIGCIYLNPIFMARSNHRYDTADYTKIDTMLGSEDDFKELCSSAEKFGIKIILDGVFSHTGSDSIYFKEGSPYRQWYSFNEDGTYKCWWGVKDLPEVDENNKSYREYICGENGVIAKWLKLGASGFRLDVADELPDSFIRLVKERIKAVKPDAVLIGEVWEDASNKFSHGEHRKYLMGDELNGVMNYPLRKALIDFANGTITSFDAMRIVLGQIENYPGQALYSDMNLLGSHDRVRILTVLGGDKDKLKMLYALLFAMPGVPSIYYGDEAGLMGGADPENRAGYPWGREDEDLIQFFKDLSKEYKEHTALVDGDLTALNFDKDLIAFTRSNSNEKVLVLSNRSGENKKIVFEEKEYEIACTATIFIRF